MFTTKTKRELERVTEERNNLNAVLEALGRSMAVIEFDLNGKILAANANFCQTLGYVESEIVGRQHNMFVTADHKASAEYSKFWADLKQGLYFSGKFMRVDKKGNTVWIEATYNPVMGPDGKPEKVVKFASNITDRVVEEQEAEAKLGAINSSYATIEFTPEGTILDANDNFCSAMGYALDEIQGRHHEVFVEPAYSKSEEYANFWKELSAGKEQSGVFKRIARDGSEVYIQAAYIPVLLEGGCVHKIIKVAADITEQKRQENKLCDLINESKEVFVDVSRGVLRSRVTGDYEGHMDELKTEINRGMDNLCTAMKGIDNALVGVDSSTSQVTTIIEGLSEKILTTEGSVTHANAVMDETVETVKSTQTKVVDAADSTKEQQKLIDSGTELMGDTLRAIEQIKNSSEQITNIVSLIDGIAFQTNLLALNAAVEAARAGEHGRGFAVVAGEVRSLAGKSADAAKEIKELIEQAVAESQNGVDVVRNLSDNLELIRDKSNEVNEIIDEVGRLADEQAGGVTSIETEIRKIGNATSENSDFVKKSSAAGAMAAEKTEEVKSVLKNFSF